jgi:hypothetical protein
VEGLHGLALLVRPGSTEKIAHRYAVELVGTLGADIDGGRFPRFAYAPAVPLSRTLTSQGTTFGLAEPRPERCRRVTLCDEP